MEINVRDDCKIVEVWLKREEQQDPELRKRLKPLYQTYKQRKYLVAVFHSGAQALEEQISGLLCYNKRRSAELEVRRDRARNMELAM